MKDNFISVLMIQMLITEEENGIREYVIQDAIYKKQMTSSFQIISELEPDIVIYPEMCYSEEYDPYFIDLSKDRLIVAGSHYVHWQNKTVVFHNSIKTEFSKIYACGSEPMSRIMTYEEPSINLLERDWHLRTFSAKNQNICILNCMEYYQLAYFIARNKKFSENLFGFISPCSLNNVEVFEQESRALHNHNDFVYSFVNNCISSYQGKEYAKGNSYVYGPIYKHEKEWLIKEGRDCPNHPSGIIKLDQKPGYLYGEYIIPNKISRFGRSDYYESSPQSIQTGFLYREE